MSVFFGILFLMILHPQYSWSDSFAEGKTRRCNEFWNPPYCSKWIGKGRFNEATHNIHLTNDAAPTYQDQTWTIWQLVATKRVCLEPQFSKRRDQGGQGVLICHIQGKAVGYKTARKATNPKYSTCLLWLAAKPECKHTSIMVNTWAPTQKYTKHKRRDGGSSVTIDYAE